MRRCSLKEFTVDLLVDVPVLAIGMHSRSIDIDRYRRPMSANVLAFPCSTAGSSALPGPIHSRSQNSWRIVENLRGIAI